MQKVAQAITNAIRKDKPNLTDLQIKTIKFGLECLLNELTKFAMYFIIFYIFSLHQYFVIAALFFCVFRLVAGGYHADTYWGCFFTTLIIFTCTIGVGIKVPLTIYIRLLLYMVSTVITYIYAPIDHPNKPIISEQRRKRFKYLSIITVGMLGGISFLLPTHLATIAVMAIFFESITLPIGEISKKRSRGL